MWFRFDPMMNTCLRYRVVFLSALLTSILLSGSQVIACFVPSLAEMSEGRSMTCCADYCRMETTHEAAEKDCDESRQVFSSVETLSSPSATHVFTIAKPPPNLGLIQALYPTYLDTRYPSPQASEDGLPKRYRSVEIYILIHSLLI